MKITIKTERGRIHCEKLSLFELTRVRRDGSMTGKEAGLRCASHGSWSAAVRQCARRKKVGLARPDSGCCWVSTHIHIRE
jgi:hypothetical protein